MNPNIGQENKYNSKVVPMSFHPRDLVWLMGSEARKNEGKFSTNCKGPFRIQSVVGNGAYRIEYLLGKVVPRTWNASHLKFYSS